MKLTSGLKYSNISQISRKNYAQGVEVAFDIVQPESRIFGSEVGISANNLMRVTLDQTTSLPFKDQEDPYRLDITFYFSATSLVTDAEVLVDNNATSNKIHVVKVKHPLRLISYSTHRFILD
jgi:hypothetical protein